MNRRKKIIVSVTGIFIVLLILIGLTYGYFLTRITGNGNPTSISVTTANLELVYGDGTTAILTSSTPIEPGKFSSSKDFTVTNNGNVLTDYAVTLEDFSITYANDTVIDGVSVKAGTVTKMEYPSDMKMEITCTIESDDETRNGQACGNINGTLPTENSILLTNSIEVDDTHKYVLTLTYVESEIDQSADMNKTIKGKIDIIDPKSTIDLAGIVASYQTGDYVVVNSIPVVSEIVDGSYKVIGIEPGEHTISVKYKDSNGVEQTRGTQSLTIQKGDTASVNGNTITFTDLSREVIVDITDSYEIDIDSKIKNLRILSSVSGKYIIVNDVDSELHNIGITLTSDVVSDFKDVQIKAHGKNWLNPELIDNISDYVYQKGSTYYTEPINLLPNTTYTISSSRNINTEEPIYYVIWYSDDFSTVDSSNRSYVIHNGVRKTITFTTPSNGLVRFGIDKSQLEQKYLTQILETDYMIELGGDATSFEPYVASQIVNSNSNGYVRLNSISPNMVIYTDENNIIINCTYYKSPKYFLGYNRSIINMGDSIIYQGYPYNTISTYIKTLTGVETTGIGFGSTWMPNTGSRSALSMAALADAITTGDFSEQENYISSTSSLKPYFSDNLNTLKEIDFNHIDILTISYGINDLYNGFVLENNDKYDVTTYAGALRHSIETLKEKYPNLNIVLTTPLYAVWESISENTETFVNAKGNSMSDFISKIKEIGNQYNLLVIDNYNNSGINESNYSEYLEDGVHPNYKGRKLIAENIAKEFYKYFR